MYIVYTPEEIEHITAIREKYTAARTIPDNKERAQSYLQITEELEDYIESLEEDRFNCLGGDPAAILANAEEQIPILLDQTYEEMTAGGQLSYTSDDMKKTGIGTTVNGQLLLNANFTAQIIRSELHLHITALQNDKERLQQLYSCMIDAIENYKYTDNTDISIEPAASRTPLEVIRYRRNPLSDVKFFSIMNDKTTAQLIQDNGIFKEQANGQLALCWAVNQAPQKHEQVPVYLALTYEGTEGSITKKLTAFDNAVYNAVSTRFYYWKKENEQKPLYITPQEIWRTMNGKRSGDGKAKPSKAAVKRICDSMDKMRFTRFYMDITQEIKAHYITIDDERITAGHIESYLLNCSKVEFVTDKGNTVTGYRIGEEPILYTYNAVKNHLLYVPYDMLDTSTNTSDSENVTEFRTYLLQQIQLMKNAGGTERRKSYFKRSSTILLDTLYRDTGTPTPEERIADKEFKTKESRQAVIRRLRKADREKIEGILEAWKAKGWIKEYEPVGTSRTIRGYNITV